MNRITGGMGLFGAVTANTLDVNSSATFASVNSTGTFYLANTAITATATEINEQDLSGMGGKRKIKMITIASPSSTLGSSEMDTAWAVPARCKIHDVMLHITQGTSAAGTINIGLLATTSGDADGFLAAVPTSSGAGILRSGSIAWTSSGIVPTYWGALLVPVLVANTTANIMNGGKVEPVFNELTSSKNVSYTCSTTANGSLSGYIVVDYTELL